MNAVKRFHNILTGRWGWPMICACLVWSAFSSCNKEAALQPSIPVSTDTLPQGDHSYDTTILQFYNTYHTAILYRFDSVDYNYNWTMALQAGLTVQVADTNDINLALQFLQTNWFGVYPNAFLQKTLPYRILLGEHISSTGGGAVSTVSGNAISEFLNRVSAMAGVNYVCFGIVNDSLKTLTPVQIDSTRGVLQRAFWQEALQNNQIQMPTGFSGLIDYAVVSYDPNDMQDYGMLFNYYNNSYLVPSASSDFLDYIQVITSTDSTTMANTWLSPAVDVNGYYNQKYKLITQYYLTNYGVDLQAIGNL